MFVVVEIFYQGRNVAVCARTIAQIIICTNSEFVIAAVLEMQSVPSQSQNAANGKAIAKRRRQRARKSSERGNSPAAGEGLLSECCNAVL